MGMGLHDQAVKKLKAAGRRLVCGNSYLALAEEVLTIAGLTCGEMNKDTAKRIVRAYLRDDPRSVIAAANYQPVARDVTNSYVTPKKSKYKQAREAFYFSREWRELRYQALKANDGKCSCCGRGASSGAVLHVDHIQPRSKFPALELMLSNLQVLCEDCNVGKSNKDVTDWRPRLVAK